MSDLHKNFAKIIFLKYSEKVFVYLKATSTKSTGYDKFRDVGYTVSNQNYVTIKAILSDVKPEELILKQIGLTETGAKKIIVENRAINVIKNSAKIIINGQAYYVYSDAVGNKLQILADSFGYSKIMVFKKEI